MSISTIPNPKFVLCVECKYNKPRKVFVMGRNPRKIRHCTRVIPYRKLRGQKGCDDGVMREQ